MPMTAARESVFSFKLAKTVIFFAGVFVLEVDFAIRSFVWLWRGTGFGPLVGSAVSAIAAFAFAFIFGYAYFFRSGRYGIASLLFFLPAAVAISGFISGVSIALLN